MKATLQKDTRTGNDRPSEFISPDVNILETGEGYLLQAEMPGVNKDGLDITLDGDQLTIVGHRPVETMPGNPIFGEAHKADYRRVFELDPAIDTTKVSAKIDQGVLTLVLPKSERVKPRKITIE